MVAFEVRRGLGHRLSDEDQSHDQRSFRLHGSTQDRCNLDRMLLDCPGCELSSTQEVMMATLLQGAFGAGVLESVGNVSRTTLHCWIAATVVHQHFPMFSSSAGPVMVDFSMGGFGVVVDITSGVWTKRVSPADRVGTM